MLSTFFGRKRLQSIKRYSQRHIKKVDLVYPHRVKIYYQNMGLGPFRSKFCSLHDQSLKLKMAGAVLSIARESRGQQYFSILLFEEGKAHGYT